MASEKDEGKCRRRWEAMEEELAEMQSSPGGQVTHPFASVPLARLGNEIYIKESDILSSKRSS